MSLNRLFEAVEETRRTANWRAAFGEPQVVGDQTIIPVARVGYAFGLGFGQSTGPGEEEGEPTPEGEGGGGGGGASAKPLGTFVVTPERVYFQEVTDLNKVPLAGMVMVAWGIFQLAITLRMIFGRR